MESDRFIIDSHQHFWQVGGFDYPWMTSDLGVLYQNYLPPMLDPILKLNGVAQTVLVQASNSLEETRWLLKLADEYPVIAGVVGWVDLQSESVGQQLDEFSTHPKFKGVRHLVESEPAEDWLAQERVVRGLREFQSRHLSYDLLVHPKHLQYAEVVVAQCPDLPFVVDHMAKPPIARSEIKEWAEGLKHLALYPNVSCKLSGLVTEANWTTWSTEDFRPYVDRALEYFGPDRMMFGSDWPVCLLAATYERVLETFQKLLAELSEPEREKVFCTNALTFYRINDQLTI